MHRLTAGPEQQAPWQRSISISLKCKKISVYLIILRFTPGAGRLWQELFCYSMQKEAEKVLISRLAPGSAGLDTVCCLTCGPIPGRGTPRAAVATCLVNLFSARMGILFKREPSPASRAALITKCLRVWRRDLVPGSYSTEGAAAPVPRQTGLKENTLV